jgi:hypothetical protein
MLMDIFSKISCTTCTTVATYRSTRLLQVLLLVRVRTAVNWKSFAFRTVRVQRTADSRTVGPPVLVHQHKEGSPPCGVVVGGLQ